ncbi:MAG: hypothetical protein VYD63_04115, partial [Actinomycetota bacterium]|nr:hypothetical protein [Actinomycetota bacterium]
ASSTRAAVALIVVASWPPILAASTLVAVALIVVASWPPILAASTARSVLVTAPTASTRELGGYQGLVVS